MIRRPPRSTLSSSSAASDVYKRQVEGMEVDGMGCRAHGFEIADCARRLVLKPQESVEVSMFFRPDYSGSVVKRELFVKSSVGIHKFFLKATLPHYLLPALIRTVPPTATSIAMRQLCLVLAAVALAIAAWTVIPEVMRGSGDMAGPRQSQQPDNSTAAPRNEASQKGQGHDKALEDDVHGSLVATSTSKSDAKKSDPVVADKGLAKTSKVGDKESSNEVTDRSKSKPKNKQQRDKDRDSKDKHKPAPSADNKPGGKHQAKGESKAAPTDPTPPVKKPAPSPAPKPTPSPKIKEPVQESAGDEDGWQSVTRERHKTKGANKGADRHTADRLHGSGAVAGSSRGGKEVLVRRKGKQPDESCSTETGPGSQENLWGLREKAALALLSDSQVDVVHAPAVKVRARSRSGQDRFSQAAIGTLSPRGGTTQFPLQPSTSSAAMFPSDPIGGDPIWQPETKSRPHQPTPRAPPGLAAPSCSVENRTEPSSFGPATVDPVTPGSGFFNFPSVQPSVQPTDSFFSGNPFFNTQLNEPEYSESPGLSSAIGGDLLDDVNAANDETFGAASYSPPAMPPADGLSPPGFGTAALGNGTGFGMSFSDLKTDSVPFSPPSKAQQERTRSRFGFPASPTQKDRDGSGTDFSLFG
eukprot:TRINITY_DN6774_c0_g1_i4.p1 TRINITY_DN6774_c0_g1~~TRINITY_DN6774_c0_g1_i4.p1  ORF type:complete len:640 (+),score=126.29 TRINITY_DN6774_c0_g1_i4:98-2017(+)